MLIKELTRFGTGNIFIRLSSENKSIGMGDVYS